MASSMFNFADLARSGTAPSSMTASPKLKPDSSVLPSARVPVRPTTRGADSDLSELNVNLKINKRNNNGAQLEMGSDFAQEDVGYIQAIESFQSAIDNWTDQRAAAVHINTSSSAVAGGGNSTAANGSTSPLGKLSSRSNEARPPNRRGGGGYSAYTQDPSSSILSSQRPKAVKSATSKDNRPMNPGDRMSRNHAAVVAAYGGGASAITSAGVRSSTTTTSINNAASSSSGKAVAKSSSGVKTSVTGSSSKYIDSELGDHHQHHHPSSNQWTTAADSSYNNSSSNVARRPNSTADRRSGTTISSSNAASSASAAAGAPQTDPKKTRRVVNPSPLLSATPSPTKSSMQHNNSNNVNSNNIPFSGNDDYHMNAREREISDMSPGIYNDNDLNGLDESYPDTGHFEDLRPHNNYSNSNNYKNSTHNTLLPVESDASFGFPMGNDDIIDITNNTTPERPQSRKLYLGATGGAESGGSSGGGSHTISPDDTNTPNRRKQPQSAGIRSNTMYPDVSISALRRIPSLKDNFQFVGNSNSNSINNNSTANNRSLESSASNSGDQQDDDEEEVYDDCVTVLATDNDDENNLNRPPSRQRTAFPVHLTDTNTTTTTATVRAVTSIPKTSASQLEGGFTTKISGATATVLSTGPMVVASKAIKLTGGSYGGGGAVDSSPIHININDGNDDDIDALERSISHASLTLQRPPSRQKLAAQHLFDHKSSSSSASSASSSSSAAGHSADHHMHAIDGVDGSSNGGTRRNSANRAGAFAAASSSSSSSSSTAGGGGGVMQDMADIIAPATAVPGRRGSNNSTQPNKMGGGGGVGGVGGGSGIAPNTAPSVAGYRSQDRGAGGMGLVRNNDPASDGFLDLGYNDDEVPFQIIVNRASPASGGSLTVNVNSSSSSSSAAGRHGASSASPHPFSPYSDVMDGDYGDGSSNIRSQTAPDAYNSKLIPLMPSSGASERSGSVGGPVGGGGGGGRRGISNNNSSSSTSSSSSSSASSAFVSSSSSAAAAGGGGGLSGNMSSSSIGGVRPGRRFLNNNNSNAISVNTSGPSGGGWANPSSPNGDRGDRVVRGSGGWMSATADVGRTGMTQMAMANNRQLNMSPSMSMASLMSQSQSQAHFGGAGGLDNDNDFLTEANQSFAELSAAPSLTLLSLESSLDEDFLSLFAPGI